MATRTISIRVSDEAARAYESASADERRKLDALLTVQLALSELAEVLDRPKLDRYVTTVTSVAGS